MSSRKIRAFLALNLPSSVGEKLGSIISDLSGRHKGIKWVDVSQAHITLHFMCYLDESSVGDIKSVMESLSGKIGEIELELDEIGFFPDARNPRVIFVGCKEINGRHASSLQEALGKELAKLGIGLDDRTWQPHITLGRIKDGSPDIDVSHDFIGERFKVKTFELMESKLTAEGPEYDILASYGL